MRSELYMKLLQDVEELLLSRKYGDIGMGYVHLTLYGITDERDKIAYLQSVLKTGEGENGKAEKFIRSAEKSVKEFQSDIEDMGGRNPE